MKDLRRREEFRLTERWPQPDQLFASGPEGRFVSQFIIPLVGSVRAGDPRPPWPAARTNATAVMPGGNCLYAELYSSPAAGDAILKDLVAPLVKRAVDERLISHWFFVRYGRPSRHLRIRFFGERAPLYERLLPLLMEGAGRFADGGRLWKSTLETYVPEVGRYGGPAGMQTAEQFSWADSESVLEALALVGWTGEELRRRLATLSGMDSLLDAFGLTLGERRSLVAGGRDRLADRLGVRRGFWRAVGSRFRTERLNVEAMLGEQRYPSHELDSIREAGRRSLPRLTALANTIQELEAGGSLTLPTKAVIESLLHMRVNRMLRTGHRVHEVVLLDFLTRHYDSRLAISPGAART